MSLQEEDAVEMFLGGLVLDPNSQAPVIILKDESGQQCLPIWIGMAEATSIASAIKQVTMGRPLSHDLMYTMLQELGGDIQRILITEIRDSTYYAEIVVSFGDGFHVLDSRPSDAIALAVRADAPIFVDPLVLEQAKMTLEVVEDEEEEFGEDGQEESLHFEDGEPEEFDDEALGAEGQEGEFRRHQRGFSVADLQSLGKDQWNEVLEELDPDDFKYKM